MAKKKFTKEQERAYWQECREAYIAMSRRMLDEPGWEWRDPAAFYRDIFPEGFLQEKWAASLFAPSVTINVFIIYVP